MVKAASLRFRTFIPAFTRFLSVPFAIIAFSTVHKASGTGVMSTERRKPAGAGTLLGLLQRGRGAGYREAERNPAEAEELVFACVVEDPRWDRQLEERGSYYAGLLLHFEADLGPLQRHLKEDDPDEGGSRIWLAFAVLEELGRRGRRDALSLLRGYAERGHHWPQAVRALQNCARPEAWVGLVEILRDRFPNLEALADELDPERDPVPAWRAEFPDLNTAYLRQSAERALHPSREAIFAHYDSLSVAECFAGADRREVGMLGKALRTKVRSADRPLLLRHLRAGDEVRGVLTLYGLAALGELPDWEAFRGYVEASADPPGFIWGHLARAAQAFPSPLSLPDAREWYRSPERLRSHLGRLLLARHAEPQDLGLLLAAIDPALAEDEMYRVCSALEGIARLPPTGRLPEVERAFEEATYSWARQRAADAMLVHAQDHFVRTYAFECLWDAEVRLRMLGCRHADRSHPEVRDRLAQMAADPYEDEDVKSAMQG